MADISKAAQSSSKSKTKSKSTNLKAIMITFIKVVAVMALVSMAIFALLFVFLPLPEPTIPQATRIYDINGNTVSSLFVENRIVVPYEEIPESLKKAVVAVEDKRFFSHKGIDFGSIMRAFIRNLQAGQVVEGGSTITQQLAKNLFLTHERTITRKALEAIYTVKLERHYSKQEILGMYLNIIYLGHGTYGCETASRLYFGKSAKDLTLAEAAMLAGIITGPEIYSPYHNMEGAEHRKAIALNLMADQGYIDQAVADKAKQEQIEVAGMPKSSSAAYFVDFVVAQIRKWNPEIASQIHRGGYEIYTTLDLNMQAAAEKAFSNYIPAGTKDSQGITQPQGALIAIEPGTGYIKALIGGRDWNETQLNRAYQVRRQPGSAFKIFLYTAALDLGYSVSDTQICEPVEFPGKSAGDVYKPRDFGWPAYHYAPLDIRQAVAISDNVVATKWAAQLGPKRIVEYANKLGVTSPLNANIPLALGASEVSPLEMASACATLSAQGLYAEPIAILKLLDSEGNVLLENQAKTKQVLDSGTAYMLTSVLRSVIGPGGTGSGLQGFLGNRPAAGKTGTTDGHLEAWFVGYTRELSCAVYVGWDNREESLSGTGGSVAGPIWASFMGNALMGKPYQSWRMPDSLHWEKVCDKTGQKANVTCFKWHYEIFREGNSAPACPKNHVLEILFPEDKDPEDSEANRLPYFIPKDAPAMKPDDTELEIPEDLLDHENGEGFLEDMPDDILDDMDPDDTEPDDEPEDTDPNEPDSPGTEPEGDGNSDNKQPGGNSQDDSVSKTSGKSKSKDKAAD